MKAVIVPEYGAPEVLKLVSVPKPKLGPDELLVKTKSVPVSAADMFLRAGKPYLGRLFLGLRRPKASIPGTCFSGEVIDLGKEVEGFNLRDRVFGLTGLQFGTYAEYFVVKVPGVVLKMPEDLPYDEASVFCDGHTTSYNFLTQLVNIKQGDQLLINGASGALGTSAIQIAKHYGAHVTAVCSEKNHGLARSLGADEVIDYRKEDFLNSEKQYDIIYDTVGKLKFRAAKKVLKEAGVYLSPVLTFGLFIQMIITSVFGKRKAKFEATGMNKPPRLKEFLIAVLELYKMGVLKTHIDRQYAIEHIVEAHTYVEQGHKRGNVVMKIGDE